MPKFSRAIIVFLVGVTLNYYGFSQGVPIGPGASLPEQAVGAIAIQNVVGYPAATRIPTNTPRTYVARGSIQELPAGGRTVVIRHEEIPGLMARMTMEFAVRDTNELRGLHPGDEITFRVKATGDESWVEGLQRTGVAETPASPVRPWVEWATTPGSAPNYGGSSGCKKHQTLAHQ